MARFGKSDKKTSFGKQSRAEKSFHEKKKPRLESGSSFSDRKFSKKSFSSTHSESEDKPFRKDRFSRDEKHSSRFSRDSKKSYRKPGEEGFSDERTYSARRESFKRRESSDEKKPFRKRDSGNEDSRFTDRNKPRFSRSGSSEGKPFRKRDSGNEDSRFSNRDKPRFSRPGSPEGKSFRKRDSSNEDSRFSNRDKPRFSRSGSPEEKPFRKKFLRKEGSESSPEKFDRSQVKKIKASNPPEREMPLPSGEKNPEGLIRLNKFMANSGVGSRREADEFIKMGLVTVNGVTITEMGHKVKPTDDVRYEGRKLKAEQPVYILLNKPKGFITTTDDPEERKTVMDIVANACKERIYPVGRLDRNTTGLLLLTNDGDLADKLTHPSYKAKKIYRVELSRALTQNDFQKILEGVYFEEGKAQVDDLAMVSDDGKQVGIEIHIGWNRIVRRIFEALGYEVMKLDRVVYAGLDKKELARGQWRFLKPEEIVRLKHFQG
ncbi:MAG: pseudouridine synthase [Bacteroidetes bacterium]|nr:pseudouridine synthase [Bacteroidota bacterium]